MQFFRATLKNISQVLKEKNNLEPNVLQELLKIDKNVAMSMAMDMIIAGIESVSKINKYRMC